MMHRLVIILMIIVALAAAGCGATPAATPTMPAAAPPPTESATLRPIVMGFPYIPNVQFAHFYLADAKGYYEAEGLDVAFDYNFETDVVQRVAQGTLQFALASGDSVLLARSQGLPIVTVMTNSQRFPTVLFSKAEANITTPKDLTRDGVTVGIPGRFGASWIGLLALLYAENIPREAVNVQEIGFTQVAAITEGKVTVATGYGNNEPIQLERQGIPVNVIRIADYFPLASDGLITGEQLVAGDPDVVRKFVRATLRGMADVIADPDAAFTTALDYIPELKGADQSTQDLQRAVLQATLDYWQSDKTKTEGLGFCDETNWRETYVFLRESGLLATDVDVTKAFTNQFIK
ncbi:MULTISPECIES: ABC transporter substrate-binding protein [Roseiflexus]|uniref:NMT1/THI5 like domain protein n=1 Tax=Roseiflexus castenholzii (strain DSM 13941 / HLO8) TaxID=383372 RepID=A7NLS2_ROSCS|nr:MULTISPECIES: ABC transporter substrate-binding protein [Roseiflexus]ABU58470.1 NMT1/THI5 like domain protein [Roseiflexus castenholzii DSM 13941]GIW01428.1 MAG: riboflavin-binding protein RibY [Roseiflexus sp.]